VEKALEQTLTGTYHGICKVRKLFSSTVPKELSYNKEHGKIYNGSKVFSNADERWEEDIDQEENDRVNDWICYYPDGSDRQVQNL
jgi:hypothetical protein